MTHTKMRLARFIPLVFIASFFIIPNTEALPDSFSGDVYIFAGDESGGRYAIKSNGDGTFGAITVTFTKGDNNRGGAVEDFNGDGLLDFFGCNNLTDQCYWYAQGPADIFTDQGSSSFGTLNGFEMGMAADDFNQDGNADVVASGHTDFFRTLTGNGAGGFTIANTVLSPGGLAMRGKDTGDINRDGHPDIVIALATSGEVYVFYNDGAGGFSVGTLLLDTLGNSNDPHATAVADFNGDGNLDVAAGGSLDGDVSLWTGNGSGVFTFQNLIFDFNGRTSVGNYDFDGDGDQDLVSTTQADKKVRYLAGNGDGTFAAPIELGVLATFGIGMATPPVPPIRSVVQGNVWSDMTPNAIQDGTEGGIAGVSLNLTGTNHLGQSVSLNTTSTVDGSYKFTGVLIGNGSYSLTAVPPTGHTATTTNVRTILIPEENTTIMENFGYVPHSTLSVKVYNDINGNGTDDGETGLSGVSLQLSDTDFNGTTILKTAVTDVNGTVSFSGLDPSGTTGYTLTVLSPPVGFEATTPEFSNVTILIGGSSHARSFGYKALPLPSTIQGFVFSDVNASGAKDGTEGGFAGILISLSGKTYNGTTLNETRMTAADGSFSFAMIDAADTSGYLLSTALVPDSLATTPVSTTIFLEPEQVITYDFGFKLNPPPDPDDDDDGIHNSVDLCPASVGPELTVPSERLLPNHYAQMDSDVALEVGLSSGGHSDSAFTMTQTGGCTCEQILNALPGKRNGQYKFGCPKGIVEQWISTH